MSLGPWDAGTAWDVSPPRPALPTSALRPPTSAFGPGRVWDGRPIFPSHPSRPTINLLAPCIFQTLGTAGRLQITALREYINIFHYPRLSPGTVGRQLVRPILGRSQGPSDLCPPTSALRPWKAMEAYGKLWKDLFALTDSLTHHLITGFCNGRI